MMTNYFKFTIVTFELGLLHLHYIFVTYKTPEALKQKVNLNLEFVYTDKIECPTNAT